MKDKMLIQNADTKSTGGHFKSGFGTNIKTFNIWIRTRHADMQNALRKALNVKTSSTHRNSTPLGIRRHVENVKKLKYLICNT